MKPKSNNPFIAGVRSGRSLAGLSALLLTGNVAFSATLYWDRNGATNGSGNTGGNWVASNWSTVSTGNGVATIGWTNGDSAVFSAGTDGTGAWNVNLQGNTISTPSITFEERTSNNSKTIENGTINIGGGTMTSSAWGAANNGSDVNMNCVLTGSGGLTIAAHGDTTTNGGGGGGSEFRLGNASNSFSGGLTVTSGLVSWNTDANLGDISNVITLNGGGNLCTGAFHSTARSYLIGANGGTFRNYGSTVLTLNGPLSNASGVGSTTLRRTDGGTLRVLGSMSGFTGTFINGGGATHFLLPNVDLAATDIQSPGGNVTFNGGGTAVVNSLNTSTDVYLDFGTKLNVDTGAMTLGTAHVYRTNFGPLGSLTSSSGTLTITNGAATGNLTGTNHQIQVPITDSGATPVALVKNNQNTLVLTESNTYSGGTTINGGRVETKNPTGFGSGAITVATGGQLYLTGGVPFANAVTINGLGVAETPAILGAIRFGNPSVLAGPLTVAAASRITASAAEESGTISGALLGSSALEKTGAGTISIIGDASLYSGPVTVSAGTLSLGSNLPGSSVIVGAAGSLAGEGAIGSGLTLDSGAGLVVNGTTAGALSTTSLTVAATVPVKLTGYPAVPGSPITVVNYSGALSLPGPAATSFSLANAASYRGAPVFADTGTAITLTIPAGADLVWLGTDPTNPTFWNNGTTANWQNGVVNPDGFYAGDNVLFDDTGVSKTVSLQGMLSPASVTFNNSTGNDYTVTGAGGVGLTGATGIVKNGTGTATVQGFGHNYTGPVVINGGVLQPDGNYELLGNSSGVTINAGGQLNIRAMNLGNGTRHYRMTIAGNGPDGLGAITNNAAGSPNESAGILHLTLSDNASVGGNGGRFDIGRSGPSFGSITGNGFTVTKVGTNVVCFRAPAPDIHYTVSAGTLKFEDSDLASGPHPILVNGGTLQGYGFRNFANAVSFANGTTLDNDGGGNQLWTGPFNLTGVAGSNVTPECPQQLAADPERDLRHFWPDRERQREQRPVSERLRFEHLHRFDDLRHHPGQRASAVHPRQDRRRGCDPG